MWLIGLVLHTFDLWLVSLDVIVVDEPLYPKSVDVVLDPLYTPCLSARLSPVTSNPNFLTATIQNKHHTHVYVRMQTQAKSTGTYIHNER